MAADACPTRVTRVLLCEWPQDGSIGAPPDNTIGYGCCHVARLVVGAAPRLTPSVRDWSADPDATATAVSRHHGVEHAQYSPPIGGAYGWCSPIADGQDELF